MSQHVHDALMDRVRAADPLAADTVQPLPFSTVADRFDGPAEHPRRPRRPTRRRLALGVAAIATAGFGVFAALALPVGDRTHLDVVAEARAALTRGGGILHVVTRTVSQAPSGGAMTVLRKDGTLAQRRTRSWTTERWSAVDPYRSHVIIDSPDSGRSETAIDGNRYEVGDGSHEIRTATIPKRVFDSLALLQGGPGAPSFQGNPAAVARGADPVDQIQKLLSSGAVHVTGRERFDGRDVLRLVTRSPAAGSTPAAIRIPSPVYLVDAETYEPVQITSGMGYWPAPHASPQILTTTTTFTTYERLTNTPGHTAALGIDRAGKTVTADPSLFRATPRKAQFTVAGHREVEGTRNATP
jgi:hypothetical protein